MADIAVRPIETVQLLTAIAALREHFARHFDRGWLAMIIDDLPIDFTTLRQIRTLLSVTEIYPEDVGTLRYGAVQLVRFAADLRRHLLPVLKERLGISGLSPTRYTMDSVERVQRQLLCMSFPHNLERLEDLTEELQSTLEDSRIP